MGQRQQQSRTNAARRALLGLTALAALALPSPAQAKLGEGVKMGPGRLKLGVEVEGRYDSMAGVGPFGATEGQSGIDARSNPNPGDGIGRLRGAFQLDVPGQNVRVNFTGALDWNQYLALVVNTAPASFFGASATGGIQVKPEGPLGLDITESFTRGDRLTNPILGIGVLGLQNATKLRGRWRPGGGAIETGASYEFAGEFFQPQIKSASGNTGLCLNNPRCQPERAPGYNSLTHRFGVDAKWRFLPKTGLTLEASYGMRDYYQDPTAWRVQNTNAQPIRALVGFGTLLNTRLFFSVRGGYSGVMFDGQDAMQHDWLGQAEVGYRLTETLQARVGYLRTFEPVASELLMYGSNKGYFDFRAQFSRLVLTAGAGVDFIAFLGGAGRQDTNLSANLRGEYNINDWLRLTSQFGVYSRQSSEDAGTATAAFSYNRWDLSAGIATLF